MTNTLGPGEHGIEQAHGSALYMKVTATRSRLFRDLAGIYRQKTGEEPPDDTSIDFYPLKNRLRPLKFRGSDHVQVVWINDEEDGITTVGIALTEDGSPYMPEEYLDRVEAIKETTQVPSNQLILVTSPETPPYIVLHDEFEVFNKDKKGDESSLRSFLIHQVENGIHTDYLNPQESLDFFPVFDALQVDPSDMLESGWPNA